MKITKQDVLFLSLFATFLIVSNFAYADSIICNDIIFTETSNVEVVPDDGESILRGTIPVKKIKIYGNGARVYLHTDSELYFNHRSQCMSIEDEIDSVKNLKWFLEKASAARLSRWNRER